VTKKTYNERLHNTDDMPRIEDMSENETFIKRYGGTQMLIAAPMQYNKIMARVPKGKIITSETVRAYLAKEAGATSTCHMTAGLFINICAHASVERGETDFPWWRTLRSKGELNDKCPEGLLGHKARLESEGHEIIPKGKKMYIKDYEKSLWDIE